MFIINIDPTQDLLGGPAECRFVKEGEHKYLGRGKRECYYGIMIS